MILIANNNLNSFDRMYQSLYIAGKPRSFIDFVDAACGIDKSQLNFWEVADYFAEQIGMDSYDAVQCINPIVVGLCNYKGESEKIAIYDDAKNLMTFNEGLTA